MATVKDPVCGMEFTEEEARSLGAETLEHQGETVYFCCPHCKAEFEEAHAGGEASEQ